MTTRRAEDRRCSDCFWARTVPDSPLGKRGKPAVWCHAPKGGHWCMEHLIHQMPEDIAQGCGDYDDMDEVVT